MNRSVIIVSHHFDLNWPFAADHFHTLWKEQGEVEFIRLQPDDVRRTGEIISDPIGVTRLVVLKAPVTLECVKALSDLKEAVFQTSLDEQTQQYLQSANVRDYRHISEGFWGQSVSEFGLALTLCGLRRIPQTHSQIVHDLSPWNYTPPEGIGEPGARGIQFGDDSRFVNGTIHGKRVRIVGAGNIASRYASFVHALGADVAAWDPFASEPCFHRSGARREYHLEQLMKEADIFVPMVPLLKTTKGLITADHIRSLPNGCLVVLVTRAGICDMNAIRERVLRDEISLAADVFDIEPLPLDDPLLGRHNVVHTPHNAGRTIHANLQWAELMAKQFLPR